MACSSLLWRANCNDKINNSKSIINRSMSDNHRNTCFFSCLKCAQPQAHAALRHQYQCYLTVAIFSFSSCKSFLQQVWTDSGCYGIIKSFVSSRDTVTDLRTKIVKARVNRQICVPLSQRHTNKRHWMAPGNALCIFMVIWLTWCARM